MGRFRRFLPLILLVLLLAWLFMPPAEPTVEPGSILVLDIAGGYVESAEPSLVGRLLGVI